MIRRLARPAFGLLALFAASSLTGCVTITIPGNVAAAVFAIPVLIDDGGGRMTSAGGYSDVGWFGNPDNHPAVRPKPGASGPADGTQVQVR